VKSPFGQAYADVYDAAYGDKDYEAECDLIERVFSASGNDVHTVLDLGCGTGNHAIPLARRGYRVVGVDRSDEMLAHARKKSASVAGAELDFRSGDVRTFEVDRRFDAVTLLFAVLGYQVENADALATLRTARRHLDAGGLLVFDVWYGPAVLRQRPSQRERVVESSLGRLRRRSSGVLDVRRQICTVSISFSLGEGDDERTDGVEEHRMRFFFPRELELLLDAARFELLRLGAFPDFDRDPDEETWNVLAVARALAS
jgi:SAM-dependent methyltransferase